MLAQVQRRNPFPEWQAGPGRGRLPGFSTPWKIRRLPDHVAEKGGDRVAENETMAKSMKPQVEIFPDDRALAGALAQTVAALGAEAVAARGRFRLAIPGGSVVALLGRGLAGIPVDAARWEIFWADERCVPPADPQSNCRLAQTELLSRLNVPASQIHPAAGELEPETAAAGYEAVLSAVFGTAAPPRFDLVLLGLGADGHVASLFPGNPALQETQRWVAPVRNAPKPPPERITLTLPVLNQARHVLVAAAGAGKAEVLGPVLAPERARLELPAQLLAPRNGDLRWLLDSAAAAKLKDSP